MFSIVYLLTGAACPNGPLIGVGRFEVWKKVGGINVSDSGFLLCLWSPQISTHLLSFPNSMYVYIYTYMHTYTFTQ